MNAALIVESFECAAARCDDLSPLVYERLFLEMPDVRAMFRQDSRLVRGEMLARGIEAILDFVGDRAFGQFQFASEATTHAGYDVPPDMFLRFFRIIADTLRDLLGGDWTDDMDAAWRDLLVDIDACVIEADALQGA